MNTDARTIELSYAGHPARGGDIHQMFTAELRERLKPFVFLDHFDVNTDDEWGFPFHPHSGVATFTYTQSADLHHIDTGGHEGVLKRGGVQWMAAGGGIWHEEYYRPKNGTVKGLQLWMSLPPGLENGPTEYEHASATDLPVVGATRVLAGTFQGRESPIRTPIDFNYFNVEAEGPWRFEPPADHDVAWLYTHEGAVTIAGVEVGAQHVVVLTRGEGAIEVSPADGRAEFVVGTAPGSPHDLVVGQFSMHTSEDALKEGQARVQELGRALRASGKL